MAAESSNQSSFDAALVLGAIAFVYLGVTGNLLFFAGAMACLGIMLMQKPAQRRLGYAVFAFAAIYFSVVFAYGIGKDMAVRDNHASKAANVSASMWSLVAVTESVLR